MLWAQASGLLEAGVIASILYQSRSEQCGWPCQADVQSTDVMQLEEVDDEEDDEQAPEEEKQKQVTRSYLAFCCLRSCMSACFTYSADRMHC